VCVVNGFDPAWGAPPSKVMGVPLRFRSDLGAYEFDASVAQSSGTLNTSSVERGMFRKLLERWNQGLMMQPYKKVGDPTWQYRWIPRARNVSCGAAALQAINSTPPGALRG
jgi:hypothetical protein